MNRQLHALTTTVGQSKVSLMEERIKLINQIVKSRLYICFTLEETYEEIFDNYDIDYFVDAKVIQ